MLSKRFNINRAFAKYWMNGDEPFGHRPPAGLG